MDINIFEKIYSSLSKGNDNIRASLAKIKAILADETRESNEMLKIYQKYVTNNEKITKEELIFRIMTFDHIPEEKGRKKNPKTVADTKTKLNFPPFQHYKFDENDNLICVGKSHWEGGMSNGSFNKSHGMATNKLALMWMKLCERYATRGNVRGYTYNDEMQGQAILQLAQIGLQFDESKSNNPFAYYTAAVTNSFVRIINIEKRNQNIRDDILEMNDMMPSMTRQNQDTNPKTKPSQNKFAKKKKK